MRFDTYSSADSNQQGFTLVELAIVLVIIGLIVGGVLVGQDMIKAAQIRAQITQINQFNVGVGAFRLKYDCLPGDCPTTTTTAVGAGIGDGNGVITGYPGIAYGNAVTDIASIATGGEIVRTFVDLGTAGMIGYNGTVTLAAAVVPTNFPKARITSQGIIPLGITGVNYWHLGLTPTQTLAAPIDLTAAGTFSLSISPFQAAQIDSKIDDGSPATGSVVARIGTTSGTGIYALSGGSATACYTAAGAAYNNAVVGVMDAPLCELQFRWND